MSLNETGQRIKRLEKKYDFEDHGEEIADEDDDELREMSMSGDGEILIDEEEIKPTKKYPAEPLIVEDEFREAGIEEDDVEKRLGGFAKTSMDENG